MELVAGNKNVKANHLEAIAVAWAREEMTVAWAMWLGGDGKEADLHVYESLRSWEGVPASAED